MCLSNIMQYRAEVEQNCFLGLNRLPKEFSSVNCEKKFFPLIIGLFVNFKLLCTKLRLGLKFYGS